MVRFVIRSIRLLTYTGLFIKRGLADRLMKKSVILFLLMVATVQAMAQQVVENKQRHFPKTVPAGNYSGITWLGGDRYAVVNDKSRTAGFHLMAIRIDSITGDIKDVRAESFMTSNQPNRDEEGICYVPGTNTVFVSGEGDGQIIEYNLNGQLTGRRLNIPIVFSSARSNGGFEALTYNATTRLFWTTSEHTLKNDGDKPSIDKKIPNVLRLQSFGDDLQPREQYWYVTDSSAVEGTQGKSTLGVSGLAALDDGQLVILEREVRQTDNNIGSFVHVKLYIVNPARQQSGALLQKQLLTEFRTKINLTARSFANYEGICVGPRLADGRLVLLLVADSQDQYKGYLKDWFKTVVIPSSAFFVPNTTPSTDVTSLLALVKPDDEKKTKLNTPAFLSTEELPKHMLYLPEPPATDSEAFQNDLYYYRWGKEQRETPRALQAALDEVQWTSKSFCDAAGFIIGPEECPEIFKLVQGAQKDAKATNKRAKKYYQRIRPYVQFNEPSLVAEEDSANADSYSYPSGHSVRGWVYALTLALVVPDSTEALIKRAQEFAMNRVVCGRHWKSDTDASLIEATAVMSRLHSNQAFLQQLARAREEYETIRNKRK